MVDSRAATSAAPRPPVTLHGFRDSPARFARDSTLTGSRPTSDAPADLPPAAAFTGHGEASLPAGPWAVSVGNFDGVHLGHAALADRLREVGRELGVSTAVFTFDPHPAHVVRPGAAPPALTTPRRRADLLLDRGIDAVLVQPAEPRLLRLDPATFYRTVLRERLAAAALVEGPDFRFGADRAGDTRLLARLCAADGVRLEIVPPVEVDGEPVSSSRVRRLVAVGDVRAAAALLTAPYRLTGTVVTGARRGAALGFPTANLDGIATLLPAAGVYAGRAHAPRGAQSAAVDRAAAIHVGPNATFGETALTVEVHLIDFTGDLYGRTLHVDFVERLRDTERFASVDALRRQLSADVAAAGDVMRRPAAPPPRPAT